MESQTIPNYPNPSRIGPIIAKFAELWSMFPGATFMALLDDILGMCHQNECTRLMADDVFEALIDARICEIVNGVG